MHQNSEEERKHKLPLQQRGCDFRETKQQTDTDTREIPYRPRCLLQHSEAYSDD